MKVVSTLEELERLPYRSIIVGPSWDDELYQKADATNWLTPGSSDPWDSFSLESRGPFVVLREGEILDDEERPAILSSKPNRRYVFPLRVSAYPIGQIEVQPDGQVQVHYAREDLLRQVGTAISERE
jgi:hypothetical protein